MKIPADLVCIAVLIALPAGLTADHEDGVMAQVIRIRARRDLRSTGRPDSFHARVLRDTSMTGSKLKVTPVSGNQRLADTLEIEVPRRTRVVRRAHRISVNDIRTGDVIYIEGCWLKPNFVAVRVDVNRGEAWEEYDQGRDYRRLQGRIQKIDYHACRFTLDTRTGSRKVYADRARVWRDGNVCNLEQLTCGDHVWVRGNIDGELVDAERIEVASRSKD